MPRRKAAKKVKPVPAPVPDIDRYYEDEEPFEPEDPFQPEAPVDPEEDAPKVFEPPKVTPPEKPKDVESDSGEEPATLEEVKFLGGAQEAAKKEPLPAEAEDFCDKVGRTMKLCASLPIDVKVERSPDDANIYFFFVRDPRTQKRGRGSISHDAVMEYLKDPTVWGAQARRLVNQALNLRHDS